MHNVPLVAIVCADMATRTMLRFLFKENNCDVVEVADCGPITALARARRLSLVGAVCDGREDTAATLTRLRSYNAHIPMLLFTHSGDPHVRWMAFDLGAVDVISLPAAPRDVQARLQAALSAHVSSGEQTEKDKEVVRAGGLTLWTGRREVSDEKGWSARLTRREAALLRTLMVVPGRAIRRQDLLDRAWSESYEGDGAVLEVYVRRLRAKLARPALPHRYVRTVRGHGYAFDARAAARKEQETARDEPAPILVVEDDQPTARMIEDALREAGYTVVRCTGPEAPMLARRLRPALILLDINMPGMNGVEVRRHLRADARTASIPVIATSAGESLRASLAEMEVNDFLLKPFNIDDLLLRVEKWIGSTVRGAIHAVASANGAGKTLKASPARGGYRP